MLINRPYQHGFTLIEAIVTLAISAILTAMAAPSFLNMLDKRRIGTSANAIYSSLQEARSVAVTEGTNVSGCLTNDGLNCNDTVNKGSAAQFIIFRGITPPTLATWDAIGIRTVAINTHVGDIKLGKFGGPANQVQFQADGITLGSSQNGTFTLAGRTPDKNQTVTVARTGRLRIN